MTRIVPPNIPYSVLFVLFYINVAVNVFSLLAFLVAPFLGGIFLLNGVLFHFSNILITAAVIYLATNLKNGFLVSKYAILIIFVFEIAYLFMWYDKIIAIIGSVIAVILNIVGYHSLLKRATT